MIIAGLTPAWQQISVFKQFQWGEVNRAEQVVSCASGKVLNTAAAVQALGGTAVTLSPYGGLTGQLLTTEFATVSSAVRWIETAAPTRCCTTIIDQANGQTTELVENAGALTDEELTRFAAEFRQASQRDNLVVLTGSLTAGTPSHYFGDLLRETRAKAVLDLRGPELQACLPFRPFLVKPNREELAKTVGHSLTTSAELVAAMQSLRDQGAEWVAVSAGAGILLALGPDGLWEFPSIPVQTINPIGCGDSLTAGIATGIQQGLSLPDALQLGIAAAAANAEQLLPARFEGQRANQLRTSVLAS